MYHEQNTSEFIQKDLIKNAEELEEFKNLLKEPSYELGEWAKETLCLSLDAYINHLENSIKKP